MVVAWEGIEFDQRNVRVRVCGVRPTNKQSKETCFIRSCWCLFVFSKTNSLCTHTHTHTHILSAPGMRGVSASLHRRKLTRGKRQRRRCGKVRRSHMTRLSSPYLCPFSWQPRVAWRLYHRRMSQGLSVSYLPWTCHYVLAGSHSPLLATMYQILVCKDHDQSE